MTIKVVNKKKIRNQDVGDWTDKGHILIADLGDWKMNVCLAVHELTEWALCKSKGITDKVVTDFDAFHVKQDEGEHPHESGDCPLAPYGTQHKTATAVERMVALFLDVDWEAYDGVIQKL